MSSYPYLQFDVISTENHIGRNILWSQPRASPAYSTDYDFHDGGSPIK